MVPRPVIACWSRLSECLGPRDVRTTPAVLMVPELADEPGFVHGFSTLAVGSVGLKHAPDPGPVLGARKAFLHALDLDGAAGLVDPGHLRAVDGADGRRLRPRRGGGP